MAKKKGIISPSRKKLTPKPKEEVVLESPPIKENPVAKGLLQLRNWLNPKIHKKLVWLSLSILLGLFLILIVQLYRSLLHNETFYELFMEYEKISLLPDGETKQKEFENLAQKAIALCQTFWGTSDSANGCLLTAALYTKAKTPEKAAPYLEKYYQKYHGRLIGPFALFYSAYAYEEAGNFTKALELYRESAPLWKKVEQEEVPLFHEARMLYYLGNLNEADKLFEKIITTYSDSPYREKAQNYRLLIALKHRNP